MKNDFVLTRAMLPKETARYFYIEEVDGSLSLQAKKSLGVFFLTIERTSKDGFTLLYSSDTKTNSIPRGSWAGVKEYLRSFYRQPLFSSQTANTRKGAC